MVAWGLGCGGPFAFLGGALAFLVAWSRWHR
jgi:hypothetical protein